MITDLRRLLLRIVHFLRPGRGEDELERELATHLALLENEFRGRGMSPQEARRAAGLALGGVEQTKELHRAERSLPWLEDARRDASHGLRLLLSHPGTTATAVLSLAVGIGANTAVFTVANALLFRAPLGVVEPERLVDIGIGRGDGGFNPGSYPTYLDIRRRASTLDGVYAQEMFPQALSLAIPGSVATPESVFGHFVTTSYFEVLGTRAASGRLFGAADGEQPGASPVVVLSHRYFARRFGADPGVVGRTVLVNGYPLTVIGVAPPGFQGTGVLAGELWVPLNMAPQVGAQDPAIFAARAAGWLVMGGRLKPDSSLSRAAAEIEAIGVDLRREYPDPMAARELRVLPSSAVPGNRGTIGAFSALLMLLVSLVLFVACANVAGVLLARATTRRHEMAVRLSMGASRPRLVRQLLVETAVLFLIGGAIGAALARGLTGLIVARLPRLPFPVTLSLALDGRVIAFTAGLSLLAALAFGLAPAVHASGTDPVAALKEDGPGSAGRTRLRHIFVLAQVAFSVALIVCAGLFSRALERAGSLEPGFDSKGVELVSLDLSMAGYTDATGPGFWRELIERVRGLPAVQDATLARVVPGGFEGIGLGLSPANAQPGREADRFVPGGNVVEPGYFATLRIPLVAGRDFTAADRASTQGVAIVGEAAARHFWPGQDALGKYLSQPGSSRPLRVVGVARDIRSSSLVDGLSESFVYLPLQQQYASHLTSKMTILVRTREGEHAADQIRTLVASLNPNLPMASPQPLEESIALGLVPQRVAGGLSAGLGAVGLLLAAIGAHSVTAYTVARRTRELGIRIALGADRVRVLGMVLGQGLVLVAGGCVVGLCLGACAGQVLRSFLFGISSLDPLIFVEAAALSGAILLSACYGPALHATRISPSSALRHD